MAGVTPFQAIAALRAHSSGGRGVQWASVAVWGGIGSWGRGAAEIFAGVPPFQAVAALSPVNFPGGASCEGFPFGRLGCHGQLWVGRLDGRDFDLSLGDAREALARGPSFNVAFFSFLVGGGRRRVASSSSGGWSLFVAASRGSGVEAILNFTWITTTKRGACAHLTSCVRLQRVLMRPALLRFAAAASVIALPTVASFSSRSSARQITAQTRTYSGIVPASVPLPTVVSLGLANHSPSPPLRSFRRSRPPPPLPILNVAFDPKL